MNAHHPIFIALEGIDGAGSSTQAALLVDRLRSRGIPAHLTAEPTASPASRAIREMLAGTEMPDRRALALLFAADRVLHQQEIEAALARGETVVCCRYVLSSLAYQGAEGGPGASDWISDINRLAHWPDLTILLDLPVEVAAERRALRGGSA